MKLIERTEEILYPFERAWDAAWTALPLAGWELTRADKSRGYLEAKVGMSMKTWGEEFAVSIAKTSEGSTRIQVRGRARHQWYDWGKTREDIAHFINVLQTVLKER